MSTEERLIEASEASAAQARETAISRSRRALLGHGQDHCEDCGAPIGEARRKAIPSAMRCIGCQTIFETRGARGS